MSDTIELYQDAAQSLNLHFTDSQSADINITGKTVTLYIARGIDTAPLITQTVTSHSDPAHGKSVVSLTADQTNIDARSYRYEIWLDDTPSDSGSLLIRDTIRGQS